MRLFAGQTAWLVITLLLLGVLAYYQVNEKRLFNSTSTERFSPGGASSHGGGHSGHSSNIHHK